MYHYYAKCAHVWRFKDFGSTSGNRYGYSARAQVEGAVRGITLCIGAITQDDIARIILPVAHVELYSCQSNIQKDARILNTLVN